MPKSTDWLSSTRSGQIEMAKNWNTLLSSKGTAWGVPAADITELQTMTRTAQDLLDLAMSAERTAAITAQCNEAFDYLKAKMRFIKERHFHVPPLTNDDLVSLGLKPKDPHRTPIGEPDIQPQITISSPGPHVLDLHLRPAEGMTSADPRSLDHFLVRWGIMLPSGPASPEQAAADPRLLSKVPARPEDFPMVFTNKRRTHRMEFNLDDSSKTLYATACYQNPGGLDGTYCPIISRLIP
jgi:hypothetical protein